ncbi:partial phosphoribosylformylglycinamidine synthase, partial [Methylacidimicrobium cyclopophantes]
GPAPAVDLRRERALSSSLRSLIGKGLVRSAHDLSDGGLAIALLESSLAGPEIRGAELSLPVSMAAEDLLFGESQGRVLITVSSEDLPAVEEECARREIEILRIGRITGSSLRLEQGGQRLEVELAELERLWKGALSEILRPDAEFR